MEIWGMRAGERGRGGGIGDERRSDGDDDRGMAKSRRDKGEN